MPDGVRTLPFLNVLVGLVVVIAALYWAKAVSLQAATRSVPRTPHHSGALGGDSTDCTPRVGDIPWLPANTDTTSAVLSKVCL